MIVDQCIEDYGSGLNYNRKKWNGLLDEVMEQKIKIHKTIGTCRYIYNFYLFHNKERYDAGERFMSGKSFSVWLNNEYLPGHPEYS